MGVFVIRRAGNPLELPLQGTVRINGGIIPAVAPRHDLSRPAAAMSDQEFEAFHGQALPPKPMLRPFDGNSVLADMSRDSVLLRLFLAVAVRIHTRSSGVRKGSPNYRMMADMMASTPVSRFGARAVANSPGHSLAGAKNGLTKKNDSATVPLVAANEAKATQAANERAASSAGRAEDS